MTSTLINPYLAQMLIRPKEGIMQPFILIVIACLTAFVATAPVFAHQIEDVVHLKNGEIVRGTIIEQIPGE